MSIMQSGVVEVKLTRGLVTIIDAEDFELVSQHKWFANPGRSTHYAVRKEGRKSISLHRSLIEVADGLHVDHINGDGLDNRKSNLRLCTRSDNRRNSQKQAGCSSGFKGVFKHKDGRKSPWVATICLGGNKKKTRLFTTEIEAAQWYDEMAKEHHGEFAKLNFP